MKTTLRTLLLVAFGLVSGHAAVLIAPISGQSPDVFSPCGTGGTACTQLAYLSDVTSNITNTLQITLNTAVYLDPNANAVCPSGGCLDFVYQVINSNTSTDDIGRITAITFTGFSVDAGYSTGGEPAAGGTAFPTGTIAPGYVDRNSSDTIGFQFASSPSTAILPGITSAVMVIETNATRFTSGYTSIIDGGATNVASFQPTGAVPEPVTVVLLGLGLVGVAGVRRIRRG